MIKDSKNSGFRPSQIDWQAQWHAHARGFSNGYAHVDLQDYAPELITSSWPRKLRLAPGPGFGDLSHSTTRLVLRLMAQIVPGKHVLDVGCGSGILSLAALAMGAQSVAGIDIDPEAISHAAANAHLNGMGEAIVFSNTETYCQHCQANSLVILMNMIHSEQCIAWKNISILHSRINQMVVSGVLAEEWPSYLALTSRWQWQELHHQQEGVWMGGIFNYPRNGSSRC